MYRRSKIIRRRKFSFRRKNKFFNKRVRRVAKRTVINLAETKFKVINVNTTVTDASGYEFAFGDAITIGTGNDQRIGNQIRILRIGFDLSTLYVSGLSNVTGVWVRVILAYPRKGVSTSDLTSYFTSSNPGVFGRLDPDQALTLYDRRNWIQSPGSGTGNVTNRYKFWKYCKLAVMNYEDSTATLDNTWILYVASNALTVSGAYVDLRGTISVSYKDM